MKKLSTTKKNQVVKLFLTALTYEEIVTQAGVGHGSVVSIIEQFREGQLVLSTGMSEYVDELRRVAVDMKKRGTNVAQLKVLTKLHGKLQQMGASDAEVAEWLDVSQEIAAPAATGGELIQAAIELAGLEMETGLSYGQLVADYGMQAERLQEINTEIAAHKSKLVQLKQQKEEVQAALEVIAESLDEAEEVLDKQKADLEAEIESNLADHKLTMEAVDLVAAVVEEGFVGAGLGKEEMEALSKRVMEAGSLSVITRQLEERRKTLVADMAALSKKKAEIEKEANQFGAVVHVMAGLFAQSQAKEEELAALNHSAEVMKDALHEARLIAAFLTAPNGLSIPEFDAFLDLLMNLRLGRGGLPPGLCFGQSALASDEALSDIDLDAARGRLAEDLLPLVKDKFLLRSEHALAMARADEEKAQLRLFNVVKSI